MASSTIRLSPMLRAAAAQVKNSSTEQLKLWCARLLALTFRLSLARFVRRSVTLETD
jgi:hypothetical protein